MIDEIINEQNRNSHRPYYDRAEKCWRVTFPDRDAEEGDLPYVASEYARTGLYFPYYTTKALGGRGHDHYFEGVLESLLDDPEGFSIQRFEEYVIQLLLNGLLNTVLHTGWKWIIIVMNLYSKPKAPKKSV